MIHHELGGSYVLDDDGRREPVESRDPRSLAMAAEDQNANDAMLCMIEAARDWLWWIFEPGPHPVAVMRRLVDCTARLAPWLTDGLSPQDAFAVSLLATEKQSLARVCRATPKQVHDALAPAYWRLPDPDAVKLSVTSIEMKLMLEQAITGDEALLRGQAIQTWLARVWDYSEQPGWRPRLREAMKALYVEARTLAPEMILNMTGEEIAALFRQGRAAESARVKQRVNKRLERAGFRQTTLRFQKSVTACRTYAKAQRGNRNRRAKVA